MKKIFIPAHLKKNPIPAVEKALQLLEGYDRIGLLSTSQHLNQLEKIGDYLQDQGKKTVSGGQILGCNQQNAEKIKDDVDCFLYIGSGRFHPIKVAVQTEKPVFIANPYSNSADVITGEEKKKYAKKKKSRLMKALEAKVFGIIISTKTGQFNLKEARDIKKRLEGLDREAFLFAGSEINPDNLLPFNVDAWVNTACPRIVDDFFDKPVLNPEEITTLEELLRET